MIVGAWALDAEPAYAGDEPKRGGVLKMARPEEPLSLTGFTISDNGSIWAIEQICDSLIEPDQTGYGLRPAIAESWDISDDGLVYTFKIRDAMFSNGDPVTMEDIQFSLDKATDPEGYLGFVYPPMKREVIDDKTLRITLEAPFTPLLSTLSLFVGSIVHKATYEADPEGFGVMPLCAGPFMVESFERGSKLVLTPNEHYWDRRADGGPAPYLDRVELLYVPETNTRMLGLKSGGHDIVNVVPLNQAKAVEEDPNLTLEVAPSFPPRLRLYESPSQAARRQADSARDELCGQPGDDQEDRLFRIWHATELLYAHHQLSLRRRGADSLRPRKGEATAG